MIQAIPTRYSGLQMRSRLEARFAECLDKMSIKWLYEPEGYSLDGTWYLPDFFLPELDLFVEVKGVMGELDRLKIELLVQHSKKPCLVVPPFNTLAELMQQPLELLTWDDSTKQIALSSCSPFLERKRQQQKEALAKLEKEDEDRFERVGLRPDAILEHRRQRGEITQREYREQFLALAGLDMEKLAAINRASPSPEIQRERKIARQARLLWLSSFGAQ